MSGDEAMFRRAAVRQLVLGLLAAAVVATAASASAMADASSNIRRSPGESAAFTLPGSNGYSLYFKSEKGQLTIIASQRRPMQPTITPDGKLVPARLGASSESTYLVSGVARDPSTIDADLGSAGRVSLTFEPSGQKTVTRVDLSSKTEKCVGATKIVRRLGNFVGSVIFQGENGYTTAEAISVPGTVGTSAFRNCTEVHESGPEEPVVPQEGAILTVGGETVFFATRNSEVARFNAFAVEELGGGIAVIRNATAVGKPSLFPFSSSGLRASLRPPAPFSGTGVYRASRNGSRSWRGDLSVSFPGVEQPLTGKGMTKISLRSFRPKG